MYFACRPIVVCTVNGYDSGAPLIYVAPYKYFYYDYGYVYVVCMCDVRILCVSTQVYMRRTCARSVLINIPSRVGLSLRGPHAKFIEGPFVPFPYHSTTPFP